MIDLLPDLCCLYGSFPLACNKLTCSTAALQIREAVKRKKDAMSTAASIDVVLKSVETEAGTTPIQKRRSLNDIGISARAWIKSSEMYIYVLARASVILGNLISFLQSLSD